MKYIAKNKGLFSRTGLYSSTGAKFEMPKGVTAKYADAGSSIYFQLFSDGEKLTPVATTLEVNGSIWTLELQGGGYCDMNPETREYSPKYISKTGKLVVYEDGLVSIIKDDGTWSDADYYLEKNRLGKKINESYMFSSLVSLERKDGKCAIFNTETGSFLTGFEFDAGEFDIVSAIGADTKNVEHDMMFVIEDESQISKDEQTKKVAKRFKVITEDGKPVFETMATDILWQVEREEKTSAGKKDYIYIAFAGVQDGKLTTTIAKLDMDGQSVVYKTKITGLAELGLQESENLIFTENNSLIVCTNQPQKFRKKLGASIIYADGTAKVVRPNEYESIDIVREPASRSTRVADDDSLVFVTSKKDESGKLRFGAFKLTKEALVEHLLDDVWASVELKKDKNRNMYLEYKNENRYGRYRLVGSAQSFESSPSEFISLVSPYFEKEVAKREASKAEDKSSPETTGAAALLARAKALRAGSQKKPENSSGTNGGTPFGLE